MNGNPNGYSPNGSNGSQGSMDNTTLIGLVLVGLGALLLLGRINWNPMAYIWPFFVIVPGAMFLYAALNSKDKDTAGLIFPGVLVTGTGVLLLYQSITGHWESWAYVWALYPAMVGYALYHYGNQVGKPSDAETGMNMMRYGLMGAAALAFFFEMIVFNGIGLLLLLVFGGVGLYLLSQRDDIDLAAWMDETREKVETNLNGNKGKPKHKPKREYEDDSEHMV